MSKELVVSATNLEKRVAIVEDDQVTEIFIESEQTRNILGNVYKGKVTRVLPGMQAAFVDIGLERNAFLYVTDFFEDYQDYEDLLKVTDSLEEEPAVEEEQRTERTSDERRSRRGRRGRRSSQWRDEESRTEDSGPGAESAQTQATADSSSAGSEKTREPAPAPAEAPPTAVPVLPPVTVLKPEAIPQVLPEALEFQAQFPTTRLTGSEEYLPAPQIIPDELTVAAPPAPKRTRRPTRRRTPTRKARVDAPSTEQNFPSPRNSGSRGRRRDGSSGVPLIGDLLKEGQEIMVQVAKEPIAKKGARITSHIVLPGRYLVFMPTVNHVGVSRRIDSSRERQRLRDLVVELRGDLEKGFIVRTAGEGKTRADLKADMVYLTRLWEQVKNKAEGGSAPTLLHSELDMVQRVIRDFFSDDYRAIRVDDEEEYARICEFISNFNPALVSKIRLYTKRNPIFDEFAVTAEIERGLRSKVWLKNGGYIVLNQTEALVAIDVNTGKYVGKTNSLEDTIARTNLDAVREVVRQIRLRDLGGIIIVDFIDMNDTRNQQRVWDALQGELRKDKSPSKVLPFNEFGLVAITRKRVKQSLERSLCQPCIYCDGTGMTKSVRTVCYAIHGEVRRSLSSFGPGQELIIRCHPDVGEALRSSHRFVQDELRDMTRKQITIMTDPLMHIENFDLVEV